MTTVARAEVDIRGNLDNLNRSLSQAQGNVKQAGGRMSAAFGNVKKAILPIAGVVAGIGTAAVAVAVKTGRMADELLDLSEQTGLTTDQLQEYRRVTNQAGVETDTIAKAAQQMTLRFSRGAEGSADLRQGLQQLGISAKDAEGNIRPMGEIVDEAIVGLAGMENATERNVLATKLFSRSASDLAPVLGLGADEITRLREEAQELGLVLSTEQLEAANKFRQQWDDIQQQLGAASAQIGVALIPALESGANIILNTVAPALTSLIQRWTDITQHAELFRLKWLEVWLKIQETTFAGVDLVLGAMARLTSFVPILGDKVANAREEFRLWAEESLVATEEKMADIGRAITETTVAIREQTVAAGENATAMTAAAGASAKAAKFEEVAILDLDNTLQGLSLTHRELEQVAIGTSSNIEVQAGGAFQRMADHVAANAHRVLGAVTQVLNKLSGGGGFLGGLVGGIGGFLTGGPIGAALGFAGGFAAGGTIPGGSFGLVGERGPELVSGPATVTPLTASSSSVADDLLRALERAPQPITPDGVAQNTFWRQAFSALVLDGRARGVL